MGLFEKTVDRTVKEASKEINNNRRYILNSCLKTLSTFTSHLPFFRVFESFMNNQLSQIYQILESRSVKTLDGDIIKIMENVASNSENLPTNLFRAIADLEGYYSGIIDHSKQVYHIISLILTKKLVSFEQEPETANFVAQLVGLAEKMVVQSKIPEPSGRVLFDQEALISGLLSSQLIIQVLFYEYRLSRIISRYVTTGLDY